MKKKYYCYVPYLCIQLWFSCCQSSHQNVGTLQQKEDVSCTDICSSSSVYYLCPVCKKKYIRKIYIYKHIHTNHPKEPKTSFIANQFLSTYPIKYYSCPECSLEYTSRKSLRKHMHTKHAQKRVEDSFSQDYLAYQKSNATLPTHIKNRQHTLHQNRMKKPNFSFSIAYLLTKNK